MKHITLFQLLEEMRKDNIFLVDVREKDEFKAGHIKGSINMPLSKITEHPVPNADDKLFVVTCAAGARSAQAIMYWQRKAVDQIFYNFTDGFYGWAASGNEVVS